MAEQTGPTEPTQLDLEDWIEELEEIEERLDKVVDACGSAGYYIGTRVDLLTEIRKAGLKLTLDN
jgi:hypothetical protein